MVVIAKRNETKSDVDFLIGCGTSRSTVASMDTYLRARYYDPGTGRFNKLDPFAGNTEDPQSLHKYAYVHGDPVNGIDPSGEYLRLLGVLASGAIGGFISGFTAAAFAPEEARLTAFGDGFLRGAVSGVVTSALILYGNGAISPNVAAAAGAGVSTFIVDVSYDYFDGKEIDWTGAAANAAVDAVIGFATGWFVGKAGATAETITEAFEHYAEALSRANLARIPRTGKYTPANSPQWKEAAEAYRAALEQADVYLKEATLAATLFGIVETGSIQVVKEVYALAIGFVDWFDENVER